MIRSIRGLRQKLLAEKHLYKYLLYTIGENLLAIISNYTRRVGRKTEQMKELSTLIYDYLQ